MNNINKKLVEAIKDTFEVNFGERDFTERIKKIDVKVPGILEIYEEILKKEKNNYKETLKNLCNELGQILNPINKEICSNCERCCCRECWDIKAHFSFYNNKEKEDKLEFNKLMKLYNWNENGFLGKEGCNLPRENRSRTCLNYICDKMRRKLQEVNKYDEVINIIKKITDLQVKYMILY